MPAVTGPHPVVCPWCFESVELYVDPDTRGLFVEDCEVCCRPWAVHVERDARTGEAVVVRVDRAG